MDINLVAHLAMAGAELGAALEMLDLEADAVAHRHISRCLQYIEVVTECAATGTWPTPAEDEETGGMSDSIADIWAASIAAEREEVQAKMKRTLIGLTALKNKSGSYAQAHRRLLRLYQAYLLAIEKA